MSCYGSNLSDRLDCPHLIVGVHDCNEDSLRPDRAPHVIRVNSAEAVNGEHCDLSPELLQETTGIKDGRMLNSCRNNMVTLFPVCKEDPLEGMIVRFAPAAGENHLFRGATEKVSDLCSRHPHRIPGGDAGPMKAGRVAIVFCQERLHRLNSFWRYGGAGVVIEVNLSVH